MIMELVRNRSFTLTTGDSKQSRLPRLKNGVPQGSVLDPFLFNIYTYDKPSMISRKLAYADYLALLHTSGNWKDLEGTLSQDMSTLSAYLQTWRLKLSHTKTVTAAFHLNNREAKRELKVYNRGGQPAAHWTFNGGALQLGKIFQMENAPQIISSYIKGGQPMADCTLISSDHLFFRDQLGLSRKSKNLEKFFKRLSFFF